MHHAQIDKLAYQQSPIHRLDPRVKLIATLLFTISLLAAPKTQLALLPCYAVWPFTLLVIARTPLRFVAKHILITSPFIAVFAIITVFNDRTDLATIRSISIVIKFCLTVSALIAVVATTPFGQLLSALSTLGVPHLLVMQLGFLYRYIFMLINRADHMLHARSMRKLRNLGPSTEIKVASAMIGSLFLRSLDSASRISMSMQSRGFDGHLPSITESKIAKPEIIFTAILLIYLIGLNMIAKAL